MKPDPLSDLHPKFLEWLKQQPKPVQQNIRDGIERNESYTYKAWLDGAQNG